MSRYVNFDRFGLHVDGTIRWAAPWRRKRRTREFAAALEDRRRQRMIAVGRYVYNRKVGKPVTFTESFDFEVAMMEQDIAADLNRQLFGPDTAAEMTGLRAILSPLVPKEKLYIIDPGQMFHESIAPRPDDDGKP